LHNINVHCPEGDPIEILAQKGLLAVFEFWDKSDRLEAVDIGCLGRPGRLGGYFFLLNPRTGLRDFVIGNIT
jgi:hypothetical protein